MTRRNFFKRSLASIAAGSLVMAAGRGQAEAVGNVPVGTLIDLTKCDGCKGEAVPKCVAACKTKNAANYPVPVKDIPANWPQNKKEDWSGKKHLTDKLTPYNWSYVQQVQVNHNGRLHQLFIQRRCMHCDNPPCAKLCPFGVQSKTEQGAVLIDRSYCMGGAKCRDVCPWNIPQRQAGDGLYMTLLPGYIGGGVMYKCDLCSDQVGKGGSPACVDACPQKALTFGPRDAMRQLAYQRVKEIDGYIYGDKENDGTATFYISPVPFEKIHQAIMQQKEAADKSERIGIPGMQPGVENYLETPNGTALSFVLAPLAGAFAAGWAAMKTMKGEE